MESDHKPLETLVKRPIDDVTVRLQRMFMFLLKYPQMKVVYKPGKEILVADCLSRAQLPEVTEMGGLSGVIHAVTKAVCMTKDNFEFYRTTLKNNAEFSRICGYIENGWPKFHQLDDLSQQFYKFKSELHFENGLLLLNHRLVIPPEIRSKIAKYLHSPHLGIEKPLLVPEGYITGRVWQRRLKI